MSKRAKWKGPLIWSTIFNLLKKKIFKTRVRSQLVVPALLGKTIKLYTGRVYIRLKINQDMLGYKLGSFTKTRVYRKKK